MKLQSLKKDSKNDYLYYDLKNRSITKKNKFIKVFNSFIFINNINYL